MSCAINKLHKNRLRNNGPGHVLLKTTQSAAHPAAAIKTSSPTGISPTKDTVKTVKKPARNDVWAEGDSHTLPDGASSMGAFVSLVSVGKFDGEITEGVIIVQDFTA